MTEASSDWRIGVDIGGTFTDVVLWRTGAANLTQVKLLTTPEDPARAVLDGIVEALAQAGIQADRLVYDRSTKSGEAQGNVLYAQAVGRLAGERITFNIEEHTAEVK